MKNCIFTDNILLPDVQDMSAWACIACDQFTSEKDYWDSLKEIVKGKRTTLDLTLPEIYLEDEPDKRIANINANIKTWGCICLSELVGFFFSIFFR